MYLVHSKAVFLCYLRVDRLRVEGEECRVQGLGFGGFQRVHHAPYRQRLHPLPARQRLGVRHLYSLQGHLAHKKLPTPRTLQQDYTQGPAVVLGEGSVSYERGTSVVV